MRPVWAVLFLFFVMGCSGAGQEVPAGVSLPGQKSIEAKVEKNQNTVLEQSIVQKVYSDRLNPFLTLEEERSLGKADREILVGAKVSGICFSGKNSYAIVNGAILKEKDMYKGKEVVAINKNNVILKDQAGEYIAVLKND